MNRFIFFFLIFTLISLGSLYAQNDYEDTESTQIVDSTSNNRIHTISLDLNLMHTLGEFHISDDGRLKMGFGLGFMTQLKQDNNLMLGVDFIYNYMNSKDGDFEEFIDNEWRTTHYHTYTNNISFMGVAKYYFDVYIGNFNPYVEGLFGGKLLITGTNFTDPNDEDFLDSKIHKITYAWSNGIGVGGDIKLSEQIYLDIKYRYLLGSSAQYYTPRNITSSNNKDIENFDLNISKTNVGYYSIGVMFLLY